MIHTPGFVPEDGVAPTGACFDFGAMALFMAEGGGVCARMGNDAAGSGVGTRMMIVAERALFPVGRFSLGGTVTGGAAGGASGAWAGIRMILVAARAFFPSGQRLGGGAVTGGGTGAVVRGGLAGGVPGSGPPTGEGERFVLR